MQTSSEEGQLQASDESTIAQIREAHQQAQELADKSLEASAGAIKAAQKAGKLLSQVRAELGAGKYRLWCEGHFDAEFADKWASRYVACSQLSLALGDDINNKELRRGMGMLEMLPASDRENKEESDTSRRFEQVLLSRTNMLLELMGRMDNVQKREYKTQFKSLYEFLKTEVFND